jgi:hypothetical protein
VREFAVAAKLPYPTWLVFVGYDDAGDAWALGDLGHRQSATHGAILEYVTGWRSSVKFLPERLSMLDDAMRDPVGVNGPNRRRYLW